MQPSTPVLSPSSPRITLFDTTLRDGAQTRGVDFTVADKQAIALMLDELGVDYIEGGWPGANPTDDAFFAAPTSSGEGFRQARFTAFGMTRRAGRSAGNDPGLASLMNSGAGSLCIVGKSWDHQIRLALGIELEENLAMIGDSIAYIAKAGREALFDCEHFFDGYKSNPEFALECAKAALRSGARWVVLCDTNGGTLPHEVAAIVAAVARVIPGENLGIHAHNDTENAVANSLAAVQAGARQIQGTLNGLGERCGNANLVSLLPTLMLKLGYETGVSRDNLRNLTRISRALDERLNRAPNRHAAFVGESAFAHKGGLHASAVEKDATTYEHIAPELVGNQRLVLVSDQAGRANILRRCRELGIELAADSPALADLVELVKRREYYGYAYDGSDASFELLARRLLGRFREPYQVKKFRVLIERQPAHSALLDHHQDMDQAMEAISEATVQVCVGGETRLEVAEGNGPVNALDQAMRKALIAQFPVLADLQLVDYKVRILNSGDGTMAVTRVMIDSSTASGHRSSTVGVSANVIDASFLALNDALCYRLLMG